MFERHDDLIKEISEPDHELKLKLALKKRE